MSVDTLVHQLEAEIKKIYSQHQQTRKKTLKNLREPKNVSNLQKQLYLAVANGVQHLIEDAALQKQRAARFATIPKFFPAPDATSSLDCLIYSRMIMGYTMMPSGNHGRRLKTAMRKLKSQEKYVEYLLNFSKTDLLGKENFDYLCKVGCPQATHEWMIVYDLPSVLIADKSVIAKCKQLLSDFGY